MRSRILSIIPLVALSVAASAQVAFNDFSSDSNSSTYGRNAGYGYSVAGANAGSALLGAQFVAGAGGSVSQVILPVGVVDPGRYGGVAVDLLSDSGGTLGSVLETWTYTPTNNYMTFSPPDVLAGDGSASLVAGSTYWLTLTPTNVSFDGVWYFNDVNGSAVGEQGNITYSSNQGATWNYSTGTLPAFEVDVTPAPEPMSIIGLGIGGACLLRRRRVSRRNR